MIIRFLNNIRDISRDNWQLLFNSDYPFTRYEFLMALEKSGCVTLETGWQPHHALVFKADKLVAAMPMYLKTHSYGEYVFDWAWANAYQQHGQCYYPKLVSAIPFTPSSGPRLAFSPVIKNGAEKRAVIQYLNAAVQEKLVELNGSSAHLLFPNQTLSDQFSSAHWIQRSGIQYHWCNEGYQHFDDFLACFKSRKRKNILKERAAVVRQGITFSCTEGAQITDQLMQRFYSYYQQTYLKRNGSHGYLNLDFFLTLRQTMPEQLVMMVAKKSTGVIGIALCFKSAEQLYGRYWGCHQEVDFLHFETCYYQGIEYCIRHGLKKFDAGAQGEHKLARGFKPCKTFSNHLILHADFRRAIVDFTHAETVELDHYAKRALEQMPFKQNEQ